MIFKEYKKELKLILFSFSVMALTTFMLFLWNFFFCKSLCYVGMALSLLITEIIVVWPELRVKKRDKHKIARKLSYGFVGGFAWLVVMMTSVYLSVTTGLLQ